MRLNCFRGVALCVTTIACALAVSAAGPDLTSFKTRGMSNGRMWALLDNTAKAALMEGVQTGLMAFYMRLPAEKSDPLRRQTFASLFNEHMSLEEAVNAIDALRR